MIIISDTSAITGLIQIHRVEILPTLYQEVVVPDKVANELQKYQAGLPSHLWNSPQLKARALAAAGETPVQ